MAKEVITVSDSAFFVKTIDAPAGLSPKDSPEFADTAADTLSPLPLEKLRRGYVMRNGAITIFAGLDERVFGGRPESELVDALAVIPSAALLLFAHVDDGAVFFAAGQSLSLAQVENGVWKNFNSIKLSDNLKESVEQLAKIAGLDTDEACKTKLFRLASCRQINRKKIEFVLEIFDNPASESAAESKSYTVPLTLLESADLRDKSILKTSEHSKRKAGLAMLAIKSVPIIFIILALLQVGVILKQRNMDSLQNELAKIEPSAKLVEKQSEHAAELSVFNGKKLHSMEALALVNSMRPESVMFSRVVQTSPTNLEIQGTAPSVGMVDSFAKSLLKAPQIAATNPKSEVSRGSARFTISVTLK